MTITEELDEAAKAITDPELTGVVLAMMKAKDELTALTKENIQLKSDCEMFVKSGVELTEKAKQAQQREVSCRNEANGYHRDFHKCVNWLCENGYGDCTDNPVDHVLLILSTAQESNAVMREAVEYWTEFYNEALTESEKEARRYANLKDSHGMNFHQGVRSGLIKCDIGLDKLKQALSSTPNPSKELEELRRDKAIVDWLEAECAASGYHVEIRPMIIPQSNGVCISTGCGSGPFQKNTKGSSGKNPFRLAAHTAIERKDK